MKTCCEDKYCQYQTCDPNAAHGCEYQGYCDYQRPIDSRYLGICKGLPAIAQNKQTTQRLNEEGSY